MILKQNVHVFALKSKIIQTLSQNFTLDGAVSKHIGQMY